MSDSPRLPAAYEGSISEGTMNPRHLVPRFVAVLESVQPRHERVEEYRVLWAAVQIIGQFTRDEPSDVADLLGLWESEQMGYLLEGLFDALNDVAPSGCSFGSSEGDGASYGFWRYEHPDTDDCPDDECSECGERDCPHEDPLHYHHDGCPSCTDAPSRVTPQSTQG